LELPERELKVNTDELVQPSARKEQVVNTRQGIRINFIISTGINDCIFFGLFSIKAMGKKTSVNEGNG